MRADSLSPSQRCPKAGRAWGLPQDRPEGVTRSGILRLAGYENVNGFSRDPAMRSVIGRKSLDGTAAGSGTVSRFETEMLIQDESVEALATLNRAWVSRAMSMRTAEKVFRSRCFESTGRARRT